MAARGGRQSANIAPAARQAVQPEHLRMVRFEHLLTIDLNACSVFQIDVVGDHFDVAGRAFAGVTPDFGLQGDQVDEMVGLAT